MGSSHKSIPAQHRDCFLRGMKMLPLCDGVFHRLIEGAYHFTSSEAFSLSARVVFFIDALERLFHDLRINLRGGDIAVAEHLLQGMQVRAVFEQMGPQSCGAAYAA